MPLSHPIGASLYILQYKSTLDMSILLISISDACVFSWLLLLGHPSSPPHVQQARFGSLLCVVQLSCPVTPLCHPLQWISLLLCVLSFKCHSASSYQSLYLRLQIHIAPSLPSPSAGLWPRQLAVALSTVTWWVALDWCDQLLLSLI